MTPELQAALARRGMRSMRDLLARWREMEVTFAHGSPAWKRHAPARVASHFSASTVSGGFITMDWQRAAWLNGAVRRWR